MLQLSGTQLVLIFALLVFWWVTHGESLDCTLVWGEAQLGCETVQIVIIQTVVLNVCSAGKVIQSGTAVSSVMDACGKNVLDHEGVTWASIPISASKSSQGSAQCCYWDLALDPWFVPLQERTLRSLRSLAWVVALTEVPTCETDRVRCQIPGLNIQCVWETRGHKTLWQYFMLPPVRALWFQWPSDGGIY